MEADTFQSRWTVAWTCFSFAIARMKIRLSWRLDEALPFKSDSLSGQLDGQDRSESTYVRLDLDHPEREFKVSNILIFQKVQ